MRGPALGGSTFLGYELTLFPSEIDICPRSMYGTGEPPEPWDDYFHPRLYTLLGICEKHSWRLLSHDAAMKIAASNGYHFEENDYRLASGMVYKRNEGADPFVSLSRTSDGQVDYDLSCAREIVTFANVLFGHEDVRSMIEKLSEDYALDNLDQTAFERVRWLAESLKEQWGLLLLMAGSGDFGLGQYACRIRNLR